MELRARLDLLKQARSAGLGAPSALNELPAAIASKLSPSLTDRLARLRPLSPRSACIANTASYAHTEADVARLTGGEPIAPSLIRVERSWRLPLQHGSVHLAPGAWSRDLLFLDTETTGLAGGTGTVAFVVGLAQLSHEALQVSQYLMLGFGAERCMLREVSARVGARTRIATFNGKSFDLPLLATRLRMHRMTDRLTRCEQLDLLHWARRARPHDWPDTRLKTLEERWLGVQRVDDLPGELVPGAWQRWLRAHDASGLVKVLDHNRIDLLSLAGVAQLALAPEHLLNAA